MYVARLLPGTKYKYAYVDIRKSFGFSHSHVYVIANQISVCSLDLNAYEWKVFVALYPVPKLLKICVLDISVWYSRYYVLVTAVHFKSFPTTYFDMPRMLNIFRAAVFHLSIELSSLARSVI